MIGGWMQQDGGHDDAAINEQGERMDAEGYSKDGMVGRPSASANGGKGRPKRGAAGLQWQTLSEKCSLSTPRGRAWLLATFCGALKYLKDELAQPSGSGLPEPVLALRTGGEGRRGDSPKRMAVMRSSLSGYFCRKLYSSKRLWMRQTNTSFSLQRRERRQRRGASRVCGALEDRTKKEAHTTYSTQDGQRTDSG